MTELHLRGTPDLWSRRVHISVTVRAGGHPGSHSETSHRLSLTCKNHDLHL